MIPKPGEVYLVDLGMVAKTRPMVVVSREDPDPPRALALVVPFTAKNRGSPYEVAIGRPKYLQGNSWANVQGLVAVGHEKLLRRLGRVNVGSNRIRTSSSRWQIEPALAAWLPDHCTNLSI